MQHVSVNFVAPAQPGAPESINVLRMATWLLENAHHVERRGLSGRDRLTVVFVGDRSALPDWFLGELRNSFDVRFEDELYRELCQAHASVVSKCGGPYKLFSFAFLRWLVVEALFKGEQVLCYDGDIVHNVPLQDLSRAFDGLTRTATSTAFATVSDDRWFDAWREGLKFLGGGLGEFLSVYGQSVPGGRPHWVSSPEEYFAKCLIEAGHLPQDPLPEDFPYWIVPQPQLLPRLFSFVRNNEPPSIDLPMRYARRADGTDMINEKPIGFWHMQKPFMSQLSALRVFEREEARSDPGTVYAYNFYGKLAAGPGLHENDPYPDERGHDAVPRELWKLSRALLALQRVKEAQDTPPDQNLFHPVSLYRDYFVEGDFSGLFNNKRWPKPGCWAD